MVGVNNGLMLLTTDMMLKHWHARLVDWLSMVEFRARDGMPVNSKVKSLLQNTILQRFKQDSAVRFTFICANQNA